MNLKIYHQLTSALFPTSSHGFKGIYYDNQRCKYRAQVSLNAGEKALLPESLKLSASLLGGSFNNAEEAARSADKCVIPKPQKIIPEN